MTRFTSLSARVLAVVLCFSSPLRGVRSNAADRYYTG